MQQRFAAGSYTEADYGQFFYSASTEQKLELTRFHSRIQTFEGMQCLAYSKSEPMGQTRKSLLIKNALQIAKKILYISLI